MPKNNMDIDDDDDCCNDLYPKPFFEKNYLILDFKRQIKTVYLSHVISYIYLKIHGIQLSLKLRRI